MRFNPHYNLAGKHAFMSASQYHWIRYDDDKIVDRFMNRLLTQRGTELHELAHNLIRLGVTLPRTKKTLNMYVNDAIGYKLIPEQPLYYSDNCFGTADGIVFKAYKVYKEGKKGLLRVSDLKTGVTPASVNQLEVYAAIFCLEYMMKPTEIDMELRIYQNDEVLEYVGDPVQITEIMDKIVTFDKRLNALKEEVF